MDPDLLEAKGSLLDSRDPAEWLRIADDYLELYSRNPTSFRLPKDHLRLKPLIENYAYDPAGFVEFCLRVRNDCVGESYKRVHEVYRRVMGREVQKQRRARLTTGVSLIEQELERRFTQNQKVYVAAWLEQYWGKERLDRLDESRRMTTGSRLSTDVRSDICNAFWAEVDANLKNGIVPIPPEIVYDREGPSMEPHKPNSI